MLYPLRDPPLVVRCRFSVPSQWSSSLYTLHSLTEIRHLGKVRSVMPVFQLRKYIWSLMCNTCHVALWKPCVKQVVKMCAILLFFNMSHSSCSQEEPRGFCIKMKLNRCFKIVRVSATPQVTSTANVPLIEVNVSTAHGCQICFTDSLHHKIFK